MERQIINIASKIRLLNENGSPVIFAITGGNGTGKTTLTKSHQTIGLV